MKIMEIITIQEAHNFRNLTANRVNNLLQLKKELDIHNVIAISATPIKALAIELMPILILLDPTFDESAQKIFKKIYSANSYDPLSGSILRNKLSTYLERYTDNSSLKLPPLERYNVFVKLSEPTPYLIETVKDNVWKYVQDHIPEEREKVKPNYIKIQQLIKDPSFADSITKEEIDRYIDIIGKKINNPLDPEAIEGMVWAKQFEQDALKIANSQLTKEIISLRKQACYYVAILLGKAMGHYFIGGKINLLQDMVRENVNEIIKIVNSGEMKTIMFATFAQPLEPIKKILEENGIGCVLHVGGMDATATMEEFKNDNNKKVLLATSQSVGTGKLYCPFE